MLEGVWNPLQIKQVVATLMTDWDNAVDTASSDELLMREEALKPAHACCDESGRSWTARETEILLAYLRGDLELPHPPNFVNAVLVSEHRAMLEDLHETHFNATLTAVLPPPVQLVASTPHADLFKEIFWQTLTSAQATAVITLQDTSRRPGVQYEGQFTAAQVEVQYAIRVYGGGKLGLVVLSRAFAQFSGAKVLDVEYARATATKIYDN
ncbi:unnamed protein product [Phytophthora lilii]|uniref:Unnamed protein product n=1 Tax=Phytophthora lilii TaxID=2077276 RepID=A0A9W7CPS2_9STRA|nr:unnamed protein product [Phytophthora lilii]